MQLHERLRPQTLEQIVGQDRAVQTCRGLLAAGLGGQALWFTGPSGCGKTSFARILANSFASPICIEELTGRSLTAAGVRELDRIGRPYGMGLPGRAFIVNESHGMRKDAIEELLEVLDPVRDHNLWVFTTTNDGQERLFEESIDAHPILSRCKPIKLTNQGVSKPFAAYLESVDPMGPREPAFYRRLVESCKSNLRACIQRLELDAVTNYAEAVDAADSEPVAV